jgi:hypothetical protein
MINGEINNRSKQRSYGRCPLLNTTLTRSETERKKMDNKYNGWANYETWNFKLWLDNDEASYKRIQELVKSCGKDEFELASNLSDLAHNEAPELHASFYSDVMMASVREVNYLEVARSLLEQ